MNIRLRTILGFFVPAILAVIAVFILVFFYLLPNQYDSLLQLKREVVKGVADIALSDIEFSYNLYKNGTITEAEAKKIIYDKIKYVRWGNNNENYCYLFTGEGILLSHPYSPKLIGSNLRDVREGQGKSLGDLLLESARRPDDPYVIYYWYKPNEKVMTRKLNCVRYFKPWDWVVGSGVYFDDIQKQIDKQKNAAIVFFDLVIVVMLVVLGIMLWRGLEEERLRCKSEDELKASEQKFRDIHDNTASLIGLLDAEGKLINANRTSLDLLKIHPEAVLGKYFWQTPWWTHDPALQDKIQQAILQARNHKHSLRFDVTHQISDGKRITVDFSLKPLFKNSGEVRNFIVEGIDVTDQRQTEEQLRQSQKLDAIGHLAGGIAHDFNNMLGGILGAADLLAKEVEDSTRLHSFTDLIINSAENAATLTSKLLSFARKEEKNLVPVDIYKCINEALDILERTIDKRIVIKREFTAENSIVVADRSQIQNAIINLGVNSSHAMPEGGTITVSSKDVIFSQHDCKNISLDVVPGQYICLIICDTGTGIPQEHIEHIFEPFYTTKKIGEGTGLGLSTVYGMIKNHHGAIQVESTEGEGTCFIIYLPSSPVTEKESESQPIEEYSGHGLILVIDDEKVIRTTALNMLQQLGYTVLLADNGEEGLKIYEKNQDMINVVIMDMIMPGMSGEECFKKIHEINPDVCVILSSGYSQNGKAKQLKESGIFEIIKKPYRFHELARVLREAFSK